MTTTGLAEPFLRAQLETLGLAVEYVRAEGDTLYRRGEDGREIPVLDLVGGFGATILGHHHPEVTSLAQELLAAQVPVHAQFSLHPYAETVARRLNDILRRETGDPGPYLAVFANSGAEAVEAAVKHAELDRGLKAAALLERIGESIERARRAARDGAPLSPAAQRLADGGDFEALAAAVTAVNRARAEEPPVLLALSGSFHGKLIGSVQLTHNPAVREPFRALAAPCRFVPAEDPETLAAAIAEERRTVLGLALCGGAVDLVEHQLPRLCALLLEPVQGEGGVRPLTAGYAREVQRICAEADCPIVVDEVQSGMGRTGTFLASSAIGLRGDYYVLAKSLGGGIAKAAVTLVHHGRHRPEFELLHSSTFAKDAFSTLIAARTLDLLEADGGALYRRAAERGERILKQLSGVRDDFKDVVVDVRGRGLMLGLELRDQSDSPSPVLRELSRAGVLGYAAAGHLLNAHALRVFPTASAVTTLRIEPSVGITDARIDQAEAALRALCEVLRAQDGERLLGR
ncbi:aspartate aminotransferase family protein [Streptomyces sp. CBMA123]|uniref:aspartate aminotransferase family protein n=1 Tax=Streptomyces sp. CBMA123 TaxID=1896313 RepID=UPI0016619D2E|nr:aminotransferase class III-fold pyridoxal phosphate-dependent enzyme [Streptomyces sp. CBMA123]MBD0690982.1 class III aminotransferase [Streptomyces sp. CBMA123]